jgi:hypothetical protein
MPVYGSRFMARLLAAFVAAILAASASSSVPAAVTLTAMGAVALAALVLRRIPLIGGALHGIALAGGAARDVLEHCIAPCVDASVVEVRGAIVGLPRGSGPQVQFDVEPENAAPWPACGGPRPRRLRLSWFAGVCRCRSPSSGLPRSCSRSTRSRRCRRGSGCRSVRSRSCWRNSRRESGGLRGCATF